MGDPRSFDKPGLRNLVISPVLRRLQKDGYLIVYDRECGGRNRRYYQITETGEEKLAEYRSEWESYSSKISELFSGEESEE
jgi:PadR family transcriptional regulator, regulatory protein PadR